MADQTEKTKQLLELLKLLGHSQDSTTNRNVTVSQRLRDYVMVAAIDFGTTFSGYAFSFKTKPKELWMNKNWGAELGFSSYKTPTCVLVTPEKKFKSFGFEAQQEYAGLVEKDDQRYYYFDRFKMKLHNNKKLSKSTMLEATNGKQLPALDIFSMSLNYIKEHLVGQVSQQIKGDVATDMIRWVLTVPAIWSDASKQFMREAVYKAGMIDELDSAQLVIALEPEAASLYCRTLDVDKFLEQSRSVDIKIGAGTKYLVIDAGGGTLDITAHEIQNDGQIKELHFATGGPLGGTRVDDRFVNIMETIFGKGFIDNYRTTCASQWLQIMSDFEKKKRSVKHGIDGTTNIQLLYGFGTAYTKFYPGKLVEDAFKTYKGKGVTFNSGMICISNNIMANLFAPVTTGIVSHITDLLKMPKLKDVSYFFLVGGFSESSMLQHVVFQNFSQRVNILIPEESSLAVVKGAIHFGHNPAAISSRIAARTYGIKSNTDFNPNVHPLEKKTITESGIKCKDIFNAYVKKDDDVPDGFTKTMAFSPGRRNQDEAEVHIYSVDRSDVKYVTDRGVDHHGSINVDWPGSGLDRELEVSMTFGGTEIHVEAVSNPGRKRAHTKIDFLAV